MVVAVVSVGVIGLDVSAQLKLSDLNHDVYDWLNCKN